MIREHYDKVIEFNNILGQTKYEFYQEPQSKLFYDDSVLSLSRILLIDEEIKELSNAFNNNDLVEFIDALCDILYTIFAAGLVYSIQFNKLFDITKNNLDNVKIDKNILVIKRDVIDNIINNPTNKENICYLMENLKISQKDKKFELFEYSLGKIMFHIYELSEILSIDISKFFDEVHESNMTKKCDTEEEAKSSVNWYINNSKKYVEPSYRKSNCGKYYIIYNKNPRKILKSIGFKKPNIDEILGLYT